jgi:S-sulfo-L-cysteine synthase (O-acetyl-L-serine-dependent)
MVAAVKGYKIEVILSEDVSIERKRVLELLGAKLIFTSKKEGTDGAIKKLKKIYSKNPEKYFLTSQYSNPINTLTHYYQTSKEIINQLPNITHLFVGVGTSGTAVGLSMALKECNPNIKIIAVEPEKNHKIFGLKNMSQSIVPEIYTKKYFDKIETAYTLESYLSTKELIKEKGLLVGISSGAVYSVVKKYIEKEEEGNYLMIFPDRFERYASILL